MGSALKVFKEHEMSEKPSYEELERRIQELEKSECERRIAEDRLKKIFDNTQDAILIHDLEGKNLDVNDKMCRMYGLTKSEALEVSIENISSSRMSMDVLLERWQKVLNGEKLFFEWEALRPKDGSVFNVEVSIQKISFHDKDIVLASVRDITERKLAEEALRQSEVRARAQRSAIASLTLDKGVLEDDLPNSLERITEKVAATMNTARASVWTLTEDHSELCCLSLFEVGPNQHSRGMVLQTTTFPRYFEALLQDSRIFANDAQTDSRTSELTEGYLAPLGITSMLDAGILLDGSLAGVVCLEHIGSPRKWHSDEEAFVSTMAALVAQIMTNNRRKLAEAEKDKLQAQLLQAQKMESVGILAGGVAHDFNNLLHAIRGNLELLLLSKPEGHPDAGRLKTAMRSMDRAAQLIQQLLLFSRKIEANRVRVGLNQEVTDVVRMLERTIPKMISLELHLDSGIWPILGDPVQIEQTLLNLAGNAVDAMPEGGRLIIETRNVDLDTNFVATHPGSTVGRHVLLAVTDTGCGMDEATIKQAFDPFFTTKEVGQGTGLGLASVYGIVKSHGGYMHCYSESGQGTTFRIFLPAADPFEAGPDESVQTQVAVKTIMDDDNGVRTILVVDDEPTIRELTQEALEGFGYIVLQAANGEDALDIYQTNGHGIDLVLLDLNMPGMGGHKCLQELLRLNPAVQVLISSGYSANGQARESLKSGAAGYIGKPYQLKDLETAVRESLRKKPGGLRREPHLPSSHA
jgi:PAS domain S-box-containing protein